MTSGGIRFTSFPPSSDDFDDLCKERFAIPRWFFILPVGVGTALQVGANLRMGGNATVEGHYLGVTAEHRLVFHHNIFHEAITKHVTPHQLQIIKKYQNHSAF